MLKKTIKLLNFTQVYYILHPFQVHQLEYNNNQFATCFVLSCPKNKLTLRFSKFRTFFSRTCKAWSSGPSPQRLESATEVAIEVVDDTWTRLPELGTFEVMRDADGMLLMLAMEQYTQERITIQYA